MRKSILRSMALIVLSFTLVLCTGFKEPENYVLKKDGEKILVRPKMRFTNKLVVFEDMSGKEHTMRHREIKEIRVGERYMINKRFRFQQLQEVIVQSPYFMLTQAVGMVTEYKIYKKVDMTLVERMVINNDKKAASHFEKLIKPYFNDCVFLMKKCQKNIDNKAMPLENIYNFTCKD